MNALTRAEMLELREFVSDVAVMRCDIQRQETTEGEIPGYDDVTSWGPVAHVACYAYPAQVGNRRRVTSEQDVMLGDWEVMAPVSTTINVGDRVVRIVNDLGETIYEGERQGEAFVSALKVLSIRHWQTHLSLLVRGAS